ncbi:hypothetical protein G7Y79_00018g046000 [Physcia stellaris]|nr:hypothetical protein G7Y79_00018g046000 [Physcia stellaris]
MTLKEELKTKRKASKPEVKPRQANVDSFWASFYTKHPGTVYNVLPTKALAEKDNIKRAPVSYDEAALACKKAVEKIAMECRRLNQKYRDQDFDIESDLKDKKRDCLDAIDIKSEDKADPLSTKRVPDIFTNPQFYVNGASPSAVTQGPLGDCWLMTAITCISNIEGLIERVCVARDEVTGVYGFVFHRDGEWFHTIIDDKLYIAVPDWYEATWTQKNTFAQIYNSRDGECKFRDALQRGSRALYFAKCREDNETWLPLLEKAYAKAHGDYRALHTGNPHEGIEDLTGGAPSRLVICDILDKEKCWHDDICHVKKDVLLSCTTGSRDNWQDKELLKVDSPSDRSGILSFHTYAILDAVEKNGQKLVKLRNPWNPSQSEMGEFKGEWSDGSKQWTPQMMKDLQYQFSDDKGAFWMSYEDMLDKFDEIWRTRLFDDSWTITQRWTTINVPFTGEINQTEFRVTIHQESPVILVLSRLDDRYFQSMRGEYGFSLQLFLYSEGEEEYISRSIRPDKELLSANIDLPSLVPGKYSVRIKVTATRRRWEETKDLEEMKAEGIPERVLRLHYKKRPEKVLQQGRAYDYAHAKGRVTGTEEDDEEADLAHDGGDMNIVSRAKSPAYDSAVGVTPDASKESTTNEAIAIHSPADAETPGAANASSSAEARGAVEEDNESDKKDTSDSDSASDDESGKEKTPQGELERQDDELAHNPWNAVCVVGLRVFSKDEKCSIRVIRPFRQKKFVPKHINGNTKKGTS